jgi:hypothetical protein
MRRFRYARDVREVVEALGGFPAVCELTGAKFKAAYGWTSVAKSFPARLFKVMNDELKRRNTRAPPELWRQKPKANNK